MMDTLRDVQEEEIEVLKSIFMEDFETVESATAWKSVNAAQEFRISVRPLDEDLKEHVSIGIHFKLPLRYPKVVPTWTLERPVGLSPAQVVELHADLVNCAHKLLGSGEMIYELCSHAAGCVTDRNAVILPGKQKSLGEERRKREEDEAKSKEAASRLAASLRGKEEEAEAARLSLLISEDAARKEELRLEREKRALDEEKEAEERFAKSGEIGRDLRMKVWTEGGERDVMVKLGLAVAGDWMGKNLPSEVTLEGQPKFSATAHVFDILSPFFLSAQGKRKLLKVTDSIHQVCAIHHPNLCTLHGSLLARYNPISNVDSSSEGYTLTVLTDPIRTQTLQDLLSACGELRPDRAIKYLTKLLGAIERIHKDNIVHGGLRPKMIFVGGGKGEEETLVKLSGTAWYQRLVDLNKSNPWVWMAEDELPDSWICPGALEEPFVYDRPRDMWELGVVFAQMLFGLDVTRRYGSPADLIREVSRGTSPVARRVLTELLSTDGKKRSTASALLVQILESSSSNGHTITSLSSHLSLTPKSTYHPSLPSLGRPPSTPLFSPTLSKSAEQVGFFWQPRVSGSRYRSEFEELEFLGRGGGGQVVKARNRLDGHLYAIKKIRLPNDRASESKILREVTIWSRMNHPNIVRYHTSWVEADEHSQEIDTDAESTQPTETTQTTSDPSQASTPSDSASDFDEEDTDEYDGGDLDIDLGLDELNMDFLSVGHSKSISYPSIHFGNEDDASVANTPVESRNATRASSPIIPGRQSPLKRVRTLYIQMEYVEKLTLKEAIEDGVSEMDSWRLMFQILSAMLHFTSLNIIHRDLKPSNIFIDVKGDVRIGDFGLAVNQGLADPADVFLSVESSMDEVDLTSGVGTSLYIAPETISKKKLDRHVKYSNKIDMYSLGIVFFELWQPFKTGMERIHVLRDLRQSEIVFPPSWKQNSTRLARQTRIVKACLVHDPESRFSPKELLDSDLLPPRVGDDSIVETIRLLSHSGTQHAQTLITALFNQTDEDKLRKDFSYDFYDGQGPKVDNDPFAEIVREKLSRIFHRKGAVSGIDGPLLMPDSSIYGARSPVRLLDADGTVVVLPYLLNIPFLRMVARDSALTRLKRWTIAPVYRSAPGGGQPRAILNAAFDIVSDAVTAATEAEVIYVADEIVAAFPFDGETVHYLNHAKILDALVERVPAKRRALVLDILGQHGRLQRTWSKTSTELFKITGMSKALVDDLGSLDVAGDIAELRTRVLSAIMPLKHLAKEGLDELQEIINLCQSLGIKKIKYAPLLATNSDLHKNAFFFETMVVKGKTREVVAAGGRFDDVVSRLAAPDVRHSGRCPHAVGFSIAVSKLSFCAAEANLTTGKTMMTNKNEWERSFGPWAVRRCDVYVVSFNSPGLVEKRLDIAKDLWKAGINSDLMYDDDLLTLTPEHLVSACRREGILWLVIVKPKAAQGGEEGTVKLKSVLRGSEEEMKRTDLISWLQDELKKQAAIDVSVAHGTTLETISHDFPTDSMKPRQEYFAVIPDTDIRNKGKNKQKTMIIQRAQENINNAAASAATAPVFAIDIEGPAFRKLCESARWIADDEAFRVVLNIAASSKRTYLTSIRSTIQRHKLARPDDRLIWIFSLREDRSCLLTLEWT